MQPFGQAGKQCPDRGQIPRARTRGRQQVFLDCQIGETAPPLRDQPDPKVGRFVAGQFNVNSDR